MSPAFPTRFRSVAAGRASCARRCKRFAYALRRGAAFALIAGLCAGTLAACGNDDDRAQAANPSQAADASQTPSSASSFNNTPLASQFSQGSNAAPAVQIPPSSIVETPAQTPAEADAAASAPLVPPVIHTVD